MAYKFIDNKIAFVFLSCLLVASVVLLVGVGLCRTRQAKDVGCHVFGRRFNIPQQRARTLFADVLAADFVKRIDRGCWQNENEWTTYSRRVGEFRSRAFLSPLTKDSCALHVELSAQSKGLAESAAVAYTSAVQMIVDKTNEKTEAEGLAQLRNRVRKLQKKVERDGLDDDAKVRLAVAMSQLKTAQEIISKNAIIITDIQGVAADPHVWH